MKHHFCLPPRFSAHDPWCWNFLNNLSAGLGSHGANGGDGGVIEIHVDEDNTHLLFAVKWDVRGGRGGAPGRHGDPGAGGRGGHGGQGHVW